MEIDFLQYLKHLLLVFLRMTLEGTVVVFWFTANLLSYGAIMYDKSLMAMGSRGAPFRKRKVSEKSLYFLAVLGGGPGGFMAMHQFRHKLGNHKFRSKFAACMFFNALLMTVLFTAVYVL
eukprot:TRINITY_DN5210_c0_g1_i1.p1 TRINITY_DN5210_c0_g1~~TRINITY_DN5210_c0_g1_i1.p1  ORF type:complete len:120 (+),score=23.72 TRINITY_DN5210_c0_g1_i1:383-742(+)